MFALLINLQELKRQAEVSSLPSLTQRAYFTSYVVESLRPNRIGEIEHINWPIARHRGKLLDLGMGAISDLHQIEFSLVTAIVQPVFCREHSMELSEIGGTPRKINMRFPQLAVGTGASEH